MMANVTTDRIRPGAAVLCTDARLGTFEGLEPGADGRPAFLRVRRGWANEELLVGLDLVREVHRDGSVQLACSTQKFESLARGEVADWEREAAPDSSLASGPAASYGDEASLREEAQPWEQTVELKQEQLVAHKELRDVGEIRVRTEVEDVPGRLEVEAFREEVEVEHVPVGQVVTERVSPWEEDGVLIVPIYEEQLVVTKRLVLREQIRLRRVGTIETRLFEDTLQRERIVVEDPDNTGLVHEQYPTDDGAPLAEDRSSQRSERPKEGGGFFGFGRG